MAHGSIYLELMYVLIKRVDYIRCLGWNGKVCKIPSDSTIRVITLLIMQSHTQNLTHYFKTTPSIMTYVRIQKHTTCINRTSIAKHREPGQWVSFTLVVLILKKVSIL